MATTTRIPATRLASAPNRVDGPRISVCVPAYQAERHLGPTLDSILAQDADDLEIVVVDNNSTDGTSDILDRVSDPRLRVVRNTSTLPVVDNFNRAVRCSRGRLVKLVCADDILAPGCVREQAAILDELKDVVLVSTRTDFIDERGAPLRPDRGLAGLTGRHAGRTAIKRIVRSGTNPIGPPVATMFRRRDFEICNGFRNMSFLTDLDLWVRLLTLGDFFGIPKTLASFRFGTDSITALTSSRSQLSQQTTFARQLAGDPQWSVTRADDLYGRVMAVDMQMRRTGLYALSALRNSKTRNAIRRAPLAQQGGLKTAGVDGGI